MSIILADFLQSISSNSGFMIFVVSIVTAYLGIWYIFLQEPSSRPRVKPKAGRENEVEKNVPDKQ